VSFVHSVLSYLAAAGAAFGAGLVNAVAGGGTLISFPTLCALGVPAVSANITNTVALCPGYLGGSFAQRRELRELGQGLPALFLGAALGGLAGSILLVLTSEKIFRGLVPFLILLACALLALQDTVKRRLGSAGEGAPAVQRTPLLLGAVFLAAVYGGYFGAGLGIMLLALLAICIHDSLTRLNAMKQALSAVINIVAAIFFAFSGQVDWRMAGAMAIASLLGGNLGGRIASRLDPRWLRAVILVLGVAVAVKFWI
jgi:uncharacterized membrane protein YfcA